LTQLAIAWVIKNPNVSTAITGASSPDQVETAVKSVELASRITPELEKKINRILDTTPKPKMDFTTFTPGKPRRPVEEVTEQKQ